jgi:hypothetical protein
MKTCMNQLLLNILLTQHLSMLKQALQEGIVPDVENNSHRQVENNSQRQRQHNYYAATHNENDKVGLNISVSMPY